MNKKEVKRIKKIFREKINNKVYCAGDLALEMVWEKDKKWYEDELQNLFWEMASLRELEKEVLNESE